MKPVEYNPHTGRFVDTDTKITYSLQEVRQLSPVMFQTLPKTYLKMFEDFKTATATTSVTTSATKLNLNPKIDNVLYDYQREDIRRVVFEMGGRALLALGMGLGKTISSIAIAAHFSRTAEGDHVDRGSVRDPLLVVCPSYLRQNWLRELTKWGFLTEEAENEVLVVMVGKDVEDSERLATYRVVIISYDLLVRRIVDFGKLSWMMIIVDESAFLKNRETKRVKALGKYLKKSSLYLLLLSGTPALNCPRELFVQLNILYPKYFSDYYHFSIRYCEGHKDYYGWSDRGSCKERELNYVLNQLMVRRLKKDVLKSLPPKQRQKVFLDVPITAAMRKNAQRLKDLSAELANISAVDPDAPHYKKKFKQRNNLISQMFTALSHVKADVVVNFLTGLIEDKSRTEHPKIIVFAHHQHFLDQLEQMCRKEEWDYIRIDGSTSQKQRQKYVDDFVDPSGGARVALLSLKACCTGLNFTPVTTMVFAELLFEISTIKQAEDRIARITSLPGIPLEYYYLIGTGTVDERMFSSVGKKFTVLEKIMDNGNDVNGFEFIN